MIVKFFLFLIFTVIKAILSALPAFPTISAPVDFTYLTQGLRLVNQFINLKVVGSLLIAFLLVKFIFFLWSFINWLLHKIPGVS